VIVGDPFPNWTRQQVFGAIFQYPGTYGTCADFTDVIAALHAKRRLAIVAPIRWR
jgi:glycine dehydrogenase